MAISQASARFSCRGEGVVRMARRLAGHPTALKTDLRWPFRAGSGETGGVHAQVRDHGGAGEREGDPGKAAVRRPRPRAHQRGRHLSLERAAPHQAGGPGAPPGGQRPPGGRRPGRGGGPRAAGHARLELRLRGGRLPPKRPAGPVLPGGLRHRRGDPAGPARRGGGAAGPGAPALLALRARLQPHRPPPRPGGPLRRVRRRPALRATTTTRRRWPSACASTTRRPAR